MKEEKIAGLEMSKEELDSIIMSLPQILKELEEYILKKNTCSISV